MDDESKPHRRVVDAYTANDVGVCGGKKDRGNADYTRPFKIAGEVVDLDRLPRFGDDDVSDDELAAGE